MFSCTVKNVSKHPLAGSEMTPRVQETVTRNLNLLTSNAQSGVKGTANASSSISEKQLKNTQKKCSLISNVLKNTS